MRANGRGIGILAKGIRRYALRGPGHETRAGVPTIDVRLQFEPDNALVLDVSGDRGDDLAAQLRAVGVEVIHAYPDYGSVRVRARLDQVEAIAAMPQVTFVQPKQEAVTLGRASGIDRPPLLRDQRELMPRSLIRNRAPLPASLRRAFLAAPDLAGLARAARDCVPLSR